MLAIALPPWAGGTGWDPIRSGAWISNGPLLAAVRDIAQAAGANPGSVTYHFKTKDGLLLPNGLVIKYHDLKVDKRGEWSYWDGRARQKIYGAKVVENIVQALARIAVMAQTLMVPRRLVLSVHDEGVWVTREDKAERVKAEAEEALRTPLPWCLDLPLNCEVGYHKSYGSAKK